MRYLLCLAFLLPALTCLPVENHVSDDYMPRAIKPSEEFVNEAPPVLVEATYVSNIKPVEFQYFVPSESQETSGPQRYYGYDVIPNTDEDDSSDGDVKNDDYVDNVEGLDRHLRPPPETAPPTSYKVYLNDAILKQHFGSKSKYSFDKDQVGSPGKENRFRRSAGADSTSFSRSSASASSSSGNIPSQFFSNQGFDHFNRGFDQANIGSSGVSNYDYGYPGGFDQSAYYSDFNNGGYGNPSPDYSGSDGVLVSRFGGTDADGTTGVSASGTLQGVKGVSSRSGSSIDSKGKATFYTETKKFP